MAHNPTSVAERAFGTGKCFGGRRPHFGYASVEDAGRTSSRIPSAKLLIPIDRGSSSESQTAHQLNLQGFMPDAHPANAGPEGSRRIGCDERAP